MLLLETVSVSMTQALSMRSGKYSRLLEPRRRDTQYALEASWGECGTWCKFNVVGIRGGRVGMSSGNELVGRNQIAALLRPPEGILTSI